MSFHSGAAVKKEKTRVDLTQGSVAVGLLRFALPLFFGQLLQQFYHMADSWVIGNFCSNDAFAAVSSGGSLTFLVIGLFNGIAMGGGVVISRYYGAKDEPNIIKRSTTISCSACSLRRRVLWWACFWCRRCCAG